MTTGIAGFLEFLKTKREDILINDKGKFIHAIGLGISIQVLTLLFPVFTLMNVKVKPTYANRKLRNGNYNDVNDIKTKHIRPE